MGSTPIAEAEALERRLTQILVHLVDADDARGVVRLVERWAELGSLPAEALLAQARALMSLRLMDRAWVRLQEARDNDPEDVETQLLTAEMFVERGWPARARRILERVPVGQVDTRRLDDLRASAARPPMQPPENAQEVERIGDTDAVLELAERYMAAGSFVRAQSLLERLHREGEGGARVSNLLWALQGEYSSSKLPLEDLLVELSPETRLSEWDGVDLTESLRVQDDTVHDPEAAARDLLDGDEDRMDGRPAFPDLFRRGEQADETTIEDEDEVTVASSMATMEQLGEVSTDQHTDPGISETGVGGDTRIMEVIGGEVRELNLDSGSIHKPVDPAVGAFSGLDSTLDLRAYRDSMGVEPLPPDAETFLEEEDQDLIVMTRRERRERVAPPKRNRTEMEVVERGVSGTRKPIRRPPQPEVSPVPDHLAAEVTDELRPSSGRQRRSRQLVVLFLTVGLGIFGVGWMVLMGLQRVAGRQVIADAHAVVASGELRAIQELEARLDGEVKAAREPLDVRQIQLALVRVLLWSDYTGDSERLALAMSALDSVGADGGSRNEVDLVHGFLNLARGDLRGAHTRAQEVDLEDSLGRELVMRTALAQKDQSYLEDAWTRVGGVATLDGPLTELLVAEELSTALGETEVAEQARFRLLDVYGDNTWVQLARFDRAWDNLRPQQAIVKLSEAEDGLTGPESRRQEGRFHALRARLMTRLGMDGLAKDAWLQALHRDRTNPEYLYIGAGQKVQQRRLIAALDDLDTCLANRPFDSACRRGMIQILIDLDRLETARGLIDGWKTPEGDVAHLSAWVTFAEGRVQDALDALGARAPEEGGVAAYVAARAQAELSSSSVGDDALSAVVAALRDSVDPLDRILAGRSEAARMALVKAEDVEDVEKSALGLSLEDPEVHVLIGHYFEGIGRRDDAGESFDLAARLGVEHARAHFARGMFYYDPGRDLKQAKSAWNRYLALEPEGERASRTRERLRPR